MGQDDFDIFMRFKEITEKVVERIEDEKTSKMSVECDYTWFDL